MPTSTANKTKPRVTPPAKSTPVPKTGHVGDPNFMTSIARGLEVMRAFSGHRRKQTISQISLRTGLSRAAVRRCLYTLVKLGYAAQENDGYVLRPKVLTLGYAYLSSTSLAAAAQPLLDNLRDKVQEACSVGVLDGNEVVYIARAETQRVMSVVLRVGSRIPAYCTSLGRVLLTGLTAPALDDYLARTPLKALTKHTVTSRKRLLELLAATRKDGYSINDQELEPGLRSISVPIRDYAGRTVAALNVGVQTARVSMEDLRTRILPALRATAHELSLQI